MTCYISVLYFKLEGDLLDKPKAKSKRFVGLVKKYVALTGETHLSIESSADIRSFYDGNGRLDRLISSYYLADTLESIMAFRLSYTKKRISIDIIEVLRL